MKSAPTNSVTVTFDVLDFIISESLLNYPNERGFFLCGNKTPRRANVYEVDGWYSPASELDTRSWAWEDTQWANATRWAVGEQAGRLIGMAHSHPGKHPFFNYTHPSHSDVALQKEFHFDLSMILNIWESTQGLNWFMTIWHFSSPLSLDICVRDKNVLYSLYAWMKKVNSKNHWGSYGTFPQVKD